MLKYALLAGSIAIAAPALAQTAAAPAQDATVTTPSPAAQPTAAAPADTAVPAQADATAQAAPAQDAATTADSATTATASAQPATTEGQVAQIVDKEFTTYDKDSNGALNQTEFGAWMVALRTASDPATKADSPETKTWVTAAFAQADKDKSKSLSKTELTGFLSQGKS